MEASLPGMEDEVFPEVTEAAEKYVKVRDERMALTKKEVDLRDSLGALMEEHKLEEYHDDELTVTLTTNKKVKVKVKGDDPSEE